MCSSLASASRAEEEEGNSREETAPWQTTDSSSDRWMLSLTADMSDTRPRGRMTPEIITVHGDAGRRGDARRTGASVKCDERQQETDVALPPNDRCGAEDERRVRVHAAVLRSAMHSSVLVSITERNKLGWTRTHGHTRRRHGNRAPSKGAKSFEGCKKNVRGGSHSQENMLIGQEKCRNISIPMPPSRFRSAWFGLLGIQRIRQD